MFGAGGLFDFRHHLVLDRGMTVPPSGAILRFVAVARPAAAPNRAREAWRGLRPERRSWASTNPLVTAISNPAVSRGPGGQPALHSSNWSFHRVDTAITRQGLDRNPHAEPTCLRQIGCEPVNRS